MREWLMETCSCDKDHGRAILRFNKSIICYNSFMVISYLVIELDLFLLVQDY